MLTVALLVALLISLNIQMVIGCWLLAKAGDELVKIRQTIGGVKKGEATENDGS